MKNHIFALTAFLLVLTTLGCYTGKEEYTLEKAAAGITEKCPVKIDSITTLQSCEQIPVNTLVYYYMVDIDSSDFDAGSYCIHMEKYIAKHIPAYVDSTHSDLLLKKLSPKFAHVFRTKDGTKICDVSILPDVYNMKLESEEDVYKALQKLSFNTNKEIPVRLSNGTILSKADVADSYTMEYTIVLPDEMMAEAGVPALKEKLRLALLEEINGETNIQPLKDNNVVFRFICLDKNNEHLYTIDVTKKDYQ